MVTFLCMIVLVVGKGTIRMVWTNQTVKEKTYTYYEHSCGFYWNNDNSMKKRVSGCSNKIPRCKETRRCISIQLFLGRRSDSKFLITNKQRDM